MNKHIYRVWGILGLILTSAFLISCSKPESVVTKEEAEKRWGSERVCLPCHLFQQPIARQHNYKCDTCHMGNPWAEDKESAHDGLIRNPQAPENISKTCDRCHRRVLGRDVPYNADFIKDVIVSHKPKKEDMKEWRD